jgi:chorismate-pyruvate lyase
LAQTAAAFESLATFYGPQKARPLHIVELDLLSLTPFQRALLVLDGTVTKFIEAYTLEAIDIVKLAQRVESLQESDALLDLQPGAPVISRHVLLRGQESGTVYAQASSLIVPDRLAPDMREQLERDGEGIGRILRDRRVETYREVLWYGRERTPGDIADALGADCISRAYRILMGSEPVMLINERFPL